MSRNLKLTLSWNGAKFSGYQKQPHAVTVQESIEKAWNILTAENPKIIGCSRLDAQVHAFYYVLNFQTNTELSNEKIIGSLNGIFRHVLQAAICVYDCSDIDLEFHARFHSVGKHYRYLIWQGSKTHAILTPQCWHVRTGKSLVDLPFILKQFEGKKDFSAFRASDCGSSQTEKNIYKIQTHHHNLFSEMLTIDIWGDGFLKNMIRNIVGTAVDVAAEKRSKTCIQEAFQHKKRELVGVCAPGWALTLMKVYYDQNEMIYDINTANENLKG